MLSAFVDAWIAGERPRLEDYLQRARPAERPALADAIDDFVTLAPAPRYNDKTLQAIRAEATATTSGVATATLPALLTTVAHLRRADHARAGGPVEPSARDPGREAKLERYLERLEGGELDGRRLSQRLLDALARCSPSTPTRSTAPAGSATSPRPASACAAATRHRRRRARQARLLAELMSVPPAEEWDEVDELFLGGR